MRDKRVTIELKVSILLEYMALNEREGGGGGIVKEGFLKNF